MKIECGDIFAPFWATRRDHAPTLGSQVVNDSSEKYAYAVLAPKTGIITRIHVIIYRILSLPETPYVFRLETVDSGEPSGTLLSEGTMTLGLNNTGRWLGVDLEGGAHVARGQSLAVTLGPSGNETDAVGSVAWQGFSDASVGMPYSLFFDGVSWTRISSLGPSILLEYSDGSIPKIPNIMPWSGLGFVSSLYSDSAIPYHGNSFRLKTDTEISGFWCVAKMNSVDVAVTLWDGATNEIKRSAILKKNHTGDVGGYDAQYSGLFSEPFPALANSLYRIGINNNHPNSEYRDLQLYFLSMAPLSSKIWTHIPYSGFFSEVHRSESPDQSTWTDYEDDFLCIGPVIRSIG